MNCTVSFEGGKLTVWGGFQHPLMARKLAADVAGLDPADVEIVHVAMGGGFGRRGSFMDYLERAVPIAMQAGVPVQLAWSREEDIAKGFYRNAAVARMEGALGPDGRIVAFRSSFTDRHEPKEATAIPYAIPHQSLRYVETESPVPWASWRSVDASLHGFFIESFIDELAHAAAADPLEFRLAHLGTGSRAHGVLERVAEMAAWGTPPPAGRARGIAIRESFGTVVAQVAEVSLDAYGAVKVHRLFSACDPGEVVNPATFEAQIRGGANFGLSAALYGEITIQDGRVVEQNFPDYEMVRMADAPRQEVAILVVGRAGGRRRRARHAAGRAGRRQCGVRADGAARAAAAAAQGPLQSAGRLNRPAAEKCQRTISAICGMIPSGRSSAPRITTGPAISGSGSAATKAATRRAASSAASGRT